MLSTMAYSIQNIINFQKKVSNSMILSIYVRSIKDWLRPKWVLLMLNFKFKCIHILITSKILYMKHYHIIFFHNVKFSLLLWWRFHKKRTGYVPKWLILAQVHPYLVKSIKFARNSNLFVQRFTAQIYFLLCTHSLFPDY
jgi:hypothetical protein